MNLLNQNLVMLRVLIKAIKNQKLTKLIIILLNIFPNNMFEEKVLKLIQLITKHLIPLLDP